MSHRLMRTALSAAFLLLPAAACAADLIPVEDFARRPQISDPTLSPDGQHIAVRMDDYDNHNHAVMVYNVTDMKNPISMLRMPKFEIPLDIIWVSPTRLVVQKGKETGSLDKPAFYGEVLATDLDGKHVDYIYGYDNLGTRATTRAGDKGWGYVVGRPRPSNGHVYMETESWDNKGHYALYDVDAVKNARRLIGDISVSGMSFMVGNDGEVHYAYGSNDNFDFVAYRRQNGAWAPLDTTKDYRSFIPLANTPDQKRIYAFYSREGGPTSLVEQDEDGGNRKVLAKDSFSNIRSVEWTPMPRQPFATILDTGIPTANYIDPSLPAAKLHMALSKAFRGYVRFINYSEDGGQLLFSVSSDRDPGTFYLIDTKTNKVNKLFTGHPWIDPTRMAERRPLRFKASDGMELEAILTIPPGRGEANLPMVLLPHGGPHGINDDWFYDRDAQFLASRGYLVLQVNYRGSDGRGRNFTEDGYLKWGTRIQQDLIDGVKWAVAENYADPKRVCVYGASFGGYSAMMTTIRAPDMFKCAVGYAGVYDLAMMYKKGDVREEKTGRSYLHAVIGKDDADLAANSPDKLADKIPVPVLFVHGEADVRAPFAQAKAMRAAMDAAHKPYEWLSKPGEGHGFYDEKNTVEFYKTLQAFLDKYIGNSPNTASN
ncbi:Dipeptidyl aminopeptidase/acylaminoacyl peptidase [Dyella sp. OK004]|uniref:alpha/beta hydrolase family protein n=1 Tax=Dyella sp. OK004 TaxID=1855292 RepID=UPI0008F10C61|nr:prolyl oligopeptidase family serine peptidase [Dyella sp. OK004]SFS06060.1 Dipeptidyl aminopeptidase/acylaminoacyl peptidase [Dyella sp. OK004]